MADVIEMAREIGRQLQKDELYLKLELARQQSEEDEELQNAIGEFNLKRMAINNEASKADRSDEKCSSSTQKCVTLMQSLCLTKI